VSTNSEATRLNLAYYRKQAKALLKAVHAGHPDALARLARHSPDTRPALHRAQLTIARKQGFPSWPRFRAFLIQSSLAQSALDFQALVTAFIDAALSDLSRAEEMLAAHPEITSASFYTALVLGDVQRVREALDETSALAVTKGRTAPVGAAALRLLFTLRQRKIEPRRLTHRDRAPASAPRRQSQRLLYV
jgi:hypothetical protein